MLWPLLELDRLENTAVQYLCSNYINCFHGKATLDNCLIIFKMIFSVICQLETGSWASPLWLSCWTENLPCSCNSTSHQFAQTPKCRSSSHSCRLSGWWRRLGEPSEKWVGSVKHFTFQKARKPQAAPGGAPGIAAAVGVTLPSSSGPPAACTLGFYSPILVPVQQALHFS